MRTVLALRFDNKGQNGQSYDLQCCRLSQQATGEKLPLTCNVVECVVGCRNFAYRSLIEKKGGESAANNGVANYLYLFLVLCIYNLNLDNNTQQTTIRL